MKLSFIRGFTSGFSRIVWSAFGIALLSSILSVSAFATDPELTDEQKLSYAKCLQTKELTMYGTSWCPHCRHQKQLLGKYFEYITYVDCDQNRKLCLEQRVFGYPTWKLPNGKEVEQGSLESIAEQLGCDRELVDEINREQI